jgi:hypothetical protein
MTMSKVKVEARNCEETTKYLAFRNGETCSAVVLNLLHLLSDNFVMKLQSLHSENRLSFTRSVFLQLCTFSYCINH